MMTTSTHLTLNMTGDTVPLRIMSLRNLVKSDIAACLMISVATHAMLSGYMKNVSSAITTDHAVFLVVKCGCGLMLLMITQLTMD